MQTETTSQTILPDVAVKSEKAPGRPIDTNSKRQQQLLDKELKKMNGEVKRGRPVSTDSKRQQQEAEKKAKREAGLLKPGRPKFTEEQKAEAERLKAERKEAEQTRIREIAARLAAQGITDVNELANAIETEVAA